MGACHIDPLILFLGLSSSSGAVPLVGGNLRLTKVHRNIVVGTSSGKRFLIQLIESRSKHLQILNGDEFKQLMLYIVQDVYETSESTTCVLILIKTDSSDSNFSSLDLLISTKRSKFMFHLHLKGFKLQTARRAHVESVIMAYTVDLICVVRDDFYFTQTLSNGTTVHVGQLLIEACIRKVSVTKSRSWCVMLRSR